MTLAHEPPSVFRRGVSAGEQQYCRGCAHRKAGQFSEAVVEYTAALALDPHHFKAVFNRGFSHDKVCFVCR